MRRAHKLLSLLLVLTLALSLGAPVGAAYSDTNGHWAESAIDRWSGYGIVSGDGNGFNPDGNLTRGQMAKVLAETLGLTKQAEGNPFADVAADAWYTPYVLRCYEAGIMQGDGVNANPDATITREEAMVMLCRALGIAPASVEVLASFSDSGSVASWAAPYVAAMVQLGIVNGVGNNTLAPKDNLSRASLMTILDRLIVQYINEPGSYELTDKAGIVLVAAGDVTLTGETRADVLVSPAAEGKAVAFDGATVTGSVTVQAEDAKVTSENSTLPSVSFTGKGGGKVDTVKPAEPTKPAPKPTTGGSSGDGGSSHTHSWGEGTVTTAATCTAAGVKTFTCSCGQTRTEKISALGHSPAEEYTKNETGHWHVCTVCGAVLDKAAHNYGEVTDCSVAATCSVEGCGYQKAAGAHIWNAGEVTTDATCTEAGVMTYTCTSASCDTDAVTEGSQPATKNEEIPALGHTEVVDAAVAATCTAAGKTEGKHCSVCNVVIVEQTAVPALGHTEVVDAAVAATCTTAGKTEGKHCSVCNTVLTAQETVAATGHSFGNWEKADDTKHKRVCANDATHIETAAHTWNEGVVSGEVKTFTCTVCGATRTETADKNVWFEVDGEAIYLNWKADDGEIYEISNTLNEITYEWDEGKIDVLSIMHCNDAAFFAEGQSFEFIIKRAGSDEALYTIGAEIKVSGATPDCSIAGRWADGYYDIVPSEGEKAIVYSYAVWTPEGELVTFATPDSKLAFSLAEGYKVQMQAYDKIEAVNGGRSLTVTVAAASEKITLDSSNFRACTPPSARSAVKSEKALREALFQGGEISLGADITLTRDIYLNSGAPATLHLNGHTLKGLINVFFAKELTVDGTVKGSKFAAKEGDYSIIEARLYSKVAITDGAYEGSIYAATDAAVSVSGGDFGIGVVGAYNGGTAAISGGAFLSTIVAVNASASISGGSFKGDLVVSDNATASITGGTFVVNPTAYVPETHTATDNGNGTWTVTAKAAA